MCDALSTDMVEFTLHGSKPGSGHSIEEHQDPDFASKRKRKDPVAYELMETKTELHRLSTSLSTAKLEMEEAKLEAHEKQVRVFLFFLSYYILPLVSCSFFRFFN